MAAAYIVDGVALVAQGIEHRFPKPGVAGSNPAEGTGNSGHIIALHVSTTAYIALGSNLGDREGFLRHAVSTIDNAGGNSVTACSPVYESEALVVDGEEQPPYLNAVVELSTQLSAVSLLVLCHEIELSAGRIRDGRKWAPRTLDVDILLYGLETVASPVLVIPHRGLAKRRFVLQPLADLAPDLVIPLPVGLTAKEALARCDDTLAISRYADIFVADRPSDARVRLGQPFGEIDD